MPPLRGLVNLREDSVLLKLSQKQLYEEQLLVFVTRAQIEKYLKAQANLFRNDKVETAVVSKAIVNNSK